MKLTIWTCSSNGADKTAHSFGVESSLEDQGEDWNIIPKWILEIQVVRKADGYTWIMIIYKFGFDIIRYFSYNRKTVFLRA
jgi:hypothetical protein